MKIGILTFHLVPNYGAVLQAFALMNYLHRKGHDAFIVDYHCTGNNDFFSPKIFYSTKGIRHSLKSYIYFFIMLVLSKSSYTKKFNAFKRFQKRYLNLINLNDSALGAIFCGSDQIWNPSITKGLDEVFFGLHDACKNSKKIAYAASCGDVNSLSSKDKELMIAYAKKMDSISVREKPLNDFLTERGIASEVVLDPVFLLSKDDYIKHFYNESFKKRDYILVYELHEVPLIRPVVNAIAKEKNLKVVYICGYNKMTVFCYDHIYTAGPEDFLTYIANAKYVVTNSFHGLAFSLIFEKNFNICLPKVRAERLINLLDSVGLSDRVVSQVDSINTKQIDYNQVNRKKNELIGLSKKFIDKSLM